MIEWRSLQIKALHVLRSHLADRKPKGRKDRSCELLAGWLGRDAATAWRSDIRWCVRISDGTEVIVDGSFFSREQQSLLVQISSGQLVVSSETVDALKASIRDRIDELNQLNRDAFEALRMSS